MGTDACMQMPTTRLVRLKKELNNDISPPQIFLKEIMQFYSTKGKNIIIQ